MEQQGMEQQARQPSGRARRSERMQLDRALTSFRSIWRPSSLDAALAMNSKRRAPGTAVTFGVPIFLTSNSYLGSPWSRRRVGSERNPRLQGDPSAEAASSP